MQNGNLNNLEIITWGANKMDKKHCYGCDNNFYNGNNELGVKECWSFKDAKLVKRISIGHWENPPYKDKTVRTIPSCYHERGNNRQHYLSPEKIGSDGYIR